ncbi:MAG: DsbA family protein [Rhodospirillaceae bacterium]
MTRFLTRRSLRTRVSAMAISALALSGLVTAPAFAQNAALSDAQKKEVRALVREYILANPEIITEAVSLLQDKEEKAKASKVVAAINANKAALFTPPEATVIGNPKGDVTVVEFFDYNCGYCKQVYPTVMETLKEDGKIKLVLKEFPILGPGSVVASQAALAARKQNKYQDFHMAMLSHRGQLNEDSIMKIAADVKLDVKKLREDMKAPEITEILKKNHQLAQDLGIEGTPAIVVGETLVPGALQKDHLKELIADARKK